MTRALGVIFVLLAVSLPATAQNAEEPADPGAAGEPVKKPEPKKAEKADAKKADAKKADAKKADKKVAKKKPADVADEVAPEDESAEGADADMPLTREDI